MNASYMEIQDRESFIKWFVLYTVFAVVAAHVVLLFISFTMKEFSYSAYYQKIPGHVVVTALPYILVGLVYSLTQRTVNLFRIVLKVLLSAGLSLLLLAAISEIKPLSKEDSMFALYALGVFAFFMLAWDVSRNFFSVLPGMVDRILVVGNDRLADDIRRLIDSSGQQYQLVGSVAHPRQSSDSYQLNIPDLFETAKTLKANKVVISLAERRGVFPLQEMLNCKLSGIEVLDAPGMYERITGKLLIENISPSWFIFSYGFKITPWLRLTKRLVDIVCSLFGLLISTPFAPFIMLAIKLDSPGPILFRQERVGQGDVPFRLFKLRTMRPDAEKNTGAVWATKSDPRVTRFGQFLRKCRIDEIPQLINVLKGEMSLVGPRPERPEFVQKLKEIIPYYSERHFVKPGVTGWAQVRYPYGASVEDAIEKLRFDMFYIKNISLIFDLRILLKTVSVVLLGKGAR